jgi:hypothetical protein
MRLRHGSELWGYKTLCGRSEQTWLSSTLAHHEEVYGPGLTTGELIQWHFHSPPSALLGASVHHLAQEPGGHACRRCERGRTISVVR